ncbi:MAG: phosphopyruvate hydratase [Paraburkholderia sp.]|uniref:phosphopyruvate hydratase n=1 Tax=unclassified Paraburkholderia TaxID=2615204 RepID=UPI0028597162|nr:phosphopyruvate hydratase [Paraburkholderia sp. USG1]MDR8394791.1 phosphopyruvate hydratase [Paraburkholderia sp. USG1]
MSKHAVIQAISADEILDSRGNPTVDVTVTLSNGVTASASVPSGASTGEFEAVELRDGDRARYGGKGVLKAVKHVNGEIAWALNGMLVNDQRRIDEKLIETDGSDSKGVLGANAILGASLACAKAAALETGEPLFRYLGGANAHVLPVPMFNVLNGGKHGDDGPDVQEFKLVPLGAPTFREALRYGAETYHALGTVLAEAGASTNVGDEGGYVPQLPSNAAAMDLILKAIERAGYRPGEDISIGLDPAASSFYKEGHYILARDGKTLTSEQMIAYWSDWVNRYPLVSLEDPLADNDWHGFAALTKSLGGRVQVVGDDLFVTNRKFLQRGIDEHCCNSILIKLNQIGTVTETLDTAQLAFSAGYTCLVSHRSGETEDTSIADLAVALGCGQIKSGAPARGERVAKYNRLLAIERMLGDDARFAGRSAFRQLPQQA